LANQDHEFWSVAKGKPPASSSILSEKFSKKSLMVLRGESLGYRKCLSKYRGNHSPILSKQEMGIKSPKSNRGKVA
jgi:hypothetical protein